LVKARSEIVFPSKSFSEVSRIDVLVHPFYGYGLPKIGCLAARPETFQLDFLEKLSLINRIWKKAIVEAERDKSRVFILIPSGFSPNVDKKIFLEQAKARDFDKYPAGLILLALNKLKNRVILCNDFKDWNPVFSELSKRNIKLASKLKVVAFGAFTEACVSNAFTSLVKHLKKKGFKVEGSIDFHKSVSLDERGFRL